MVYWLTMHYSWFKVLKKVLKLWSVNQNDKTYFYKLYKMLVGFPHIAFYVLRASHLLKSAVEHATQDTHLTIQDAYLLCTRHYRSNSFRMNTYVSGNYKYQILKYK